MTDFVSDSNDLSDEPLSAQDIQQIVSKVVELHHQEKGASVNRNGESLLGRKVFAVAIFSDRKFATRERELRERIVSLFIEANKSLLRDPLCMVGSWYSDDWQESVLEISVIVPDRDLAIKLGREYNQFSIYDLLKREEIELGGDGILPRELESLSEAERIERLRSEIEKVRGENE